MVSSELLFLTILMLTSFFSGAVSVGQVVHNLRNLNLMNGNNGSLLSDMEFPDHSGFNAAVSANSAGCSLKTTRSKKATLLQQAQDEEEEIPVKPAAVVKLHLKHRSAGDQKKTGARKSVLESTAKDLTRIQTLHKRIVEKKNQNSISRLKKDGGRQQALHKTVVSSSPPASYSATGFHGQLMATIQSGVSLGSGEYFMDVFVGTPPKHYSLILDTGSDLNWIQCVPCYDCFEQNGPYYDPKHSTSFRNISCHDRRCDLVSSPDPPQPCKNNNNIIKPHDDHNNNNQTTTACPYFYWYGDSSNTTGDLALETFTVNLTTATGEAEFRQVENVMFGCGHWNRGLFHGAAGLLGLGRGPLSFSSQLQSLYGHSFSYCLVERNSNASVSSKLIFGEDKELLSDPQLNFTSLVGGGGGGGGGPVVDTFYYVQIKSILVGGKVLNNIPEETWNLSPEGVGGTIIDSGTTLSYFADPAYEIIKEAFVKKVGGRYPLVEDFPILKPCYNVSASASASASSSAGGSGSGSGSLLLDQLQLPTFGILFADGAVWNFPADNYFIWVDEQIVCLAMLATTPGSALSIIGNYQQQNFHILYDTNKSRLGFAPTRCADL